MFRYAVATGHAEHDVSADLKDPFAPVKAKNFAAILEPARVRDLLRAIDGYARQPVTALLRRVERLSSPCHNFLEQRDPRAIPRKRNFGRADRSTLTRSTDRHVRYLAK